VFVAHNARFDHAFLHSAFAAHGREAAFDPPVLCTLKLARVLYPHYRQHGLDALIERHGLDCAARHRAMGDADALWQFAQLLERDHDEERMRAALRRVMKVDKPRKRRLPPVGVCQ
jgi:DNA polymerase-3 subunit epsilon